MINRKNIVYTYTMNTTQTYQYFVMFKIVLDLFVYIMFAITFLSKENICSRRLINVHKMNKVENDSKN